jgi:hypothetical protein
LSDQRDEELIEIEKQVRLSIRDAVNRTSRKPFAWGGLNGYEQLEAIVQVLRRLPTESDTAYLRRLIPQVDRALEKNRLLAQDVRQAHTWLHRIAKCLRYPFSSHSTPSLASALNSQQVRREMEVLLSQLSPDMKHKPAQATLYRACRHLWKAWAADLVTCYDVPGLPADNSMLEAFFNHLRNHERRISGRKSTRSLRYLGQYQVLFVAESEQDLLTQLRQVSPAEYRAQQLRLQKLEATRQHFYRLHHQPVEATQSLLDQHSSRRAVLAALTAQLPP